MGALSFQDLAAATKRAGSFSPKSMVTAARLERLRAPQAVAIRGLPAAGWELTMSRGLNN